MTALLVALGGAFGVLLRYVISSAVHGDALPWITVGINVLGSFLLGMLVVAHGASPQTRAAVGVGFLGGFTTFSTLTVQAWLFAEEGAFLRGLVLLAVSVVLGVTAAAAGYYLSRAIGHHPG